VSDCLESDVVSECSVVCTAFASDEQWLNFCLFVVEMCVTVAVVAVGYDDSGSGKRVARNLFLL